MLSEPLSRLPPAYNSHRVRVLFFFFMLRADCVGAAVLRGRRTHPVGRQPMPGTNRRGPALSKFVWRTQQSIFAVEPFPPAKAATKSGAATSATFSRLFVKSAI